MISSVGDWLSAIFYSGPVLFLTEDSPRFFIARAMLGVLLIVIVLFAFATWSSRLSVSRLRKGQASSLGDNDTARKQLSE